MLYLTRRMALILSGATLAGLANAAEPARRDVQQQILELAARYERERRARFAAVKSPAELKDLQQNLRETFLRLLDGLPKRGGGPPPAKITGRIEAVDYVVEKLVYESFPGYFVSALLYKPKQITTALPAILNPSGHDTNSKASGDYQTFHVNLAKRGYVVLAYDPVGQGERSQFWDAAKRQSRFGLGCPEHAVLGNPLYLLGTNLARYMIWDGMRGIDYLASLKEVDSTRIGCVGHSGGGTLTSYLGALDPRIAVSAISCYMTTLPRRMGNRAEADPEADPEQDIFGFVSGGIDLAGLLAMRAPRPTLVCSAKHDFFPIEGARESFAEARHLFEVAGAAGHLDMVEADTKHKFGPLPRERAYQFLDRFLAGRKDVAKVPEVPVVPRPEIELRACRDGQVNQTFRSRPLLSMMLPDFHTRPKLPRRPLRELLRLDPDSTDAEITQVKPLTGTDQTLVVCINGTETEQWQDQKEFLRALIDGGFAMTVIDPRGVGARRALPALKGDYADWLNGVEENVAYNAFLVGKSLLGMRVTDVLTAIQKHRPIPRRVIVCGRRDAALVAAFTAAIEPKITHVAMEDMRLSFLPLFSPQGDPINAASLLPGLLQHFGDIPEVLGEIAPRKMLISAGIGRLTRDLLSAKTLKGRFSKEPKLLIDWINE